MSNCLYTSLLHGAMGGVIDCGTGKHLSRSPATDCGKRGGGAECLEN